MKKIKKKSSNIKKQKNNSNEAQLPKSNASKCLYTCESDIEEYDYKKMLKYFSEKSLKYYKHKINIAGVINTKIYLEFYKDYFTLDNKYKINYSEVVKIIENDCCFYLKCLAVNDIIIIKKNQCSLELVDFIRKIFPNLENYLKDDSKFKGVTKYNNPIFIKKIMLVLFVITILSFIIVAYFCIESALWWWAFLPIPILSIILGYKYKNIGFKCTKNIVAGFIIAFLYLFFGLLWILPDNTVDYKQIDNYRNVIDATLPKNGKLTIKKWNAYTEEDKTNFTVINVDYKGENLKKLESNIQNSNNWILSKKIKSDLMLYIPFILESDYDAYYSIYNKTTNLYNTIPENAGEYEIYVMKYDISDKHLEIYEFDFTYR